MNSGRPARQRGQAFVEFALMLPVLLLLVLIALDLGRVFLAAVTINNTARVGARHAASHPEAWGGTPDLARQAEYDAYIAAEWEDIDCDKQTPIPPPVFSGGTELGAPVHVVLTCTFHVLTPIISDIIGTTLVLTGQAIIPVTSCEGTAAVPGSGEEACIQPPTAPPPPTPCPSAPPTLSVTPGSQGGLAGAALNYAVTYTNNDDPLCQPRVVTLSAAVAGVTGWTTSFSPATFTVVGGTAANSTLTVTSAGNSSPGARTVTVSATGATDVGVVYVVQACNSAPTVSAVPATNSGAAGTPLAWTVTVTNPDPAVCPARTFTLDASFQGNSNGWLKNFAPPTLNLAAGASGNSTMTITSPGTASGTKDITPSANGTNGNVVTYVILACNQPPTVSATPLSNSGTAGSALQYTVTVTNPDPSSCGPRTFNLDATFQGNSSGWLKNFSPISLNLAGGASGNATMTIMSPASATGSKGITPTANGTAGNQVTYVVVACNQPPTVSAVPPSRTGTAGSARQWTVTVTNPDPAACAARTFTLDATFQGNSNGWLKNFSPISLNLAGGASGSSTMTITSPASASGSKNITPTANGTAGNVVTYFVQSCTTNPPTVAVAPATQSAFAGETLTYTVTVTNNDTAACADRLFLFTTSRPSNSWTVSTPASLMLAPGATGSRTWTVTPDTTVAAGPYNLDVTTAAITRTVQYVVLTPTPPPPTPSPSPSPTPTPTDTPAPTPSPTP